MRLIVYIFDTMIPFFILHIPNVRHHLSSDLQADILIFHLAYAR